MIKIRHGVFETNSSSVHALVIASPEESEKIMDEELLISGWNAGIGEDKLISRQNAIMCLEQELGKDVIDGLTWEQIKQELRNRDIAFTLEWWRDYLEHETESFVTPKGEKIDIYSAFGRDD